MNESVFVLSIDIIGGVLREFGPFFEVFLESWHETESSVFFSRVYERNESLQLHYSIVSASIVLLYKVFKDVWKTIFLVHRPFPFADFCQLREGVKKRVHGLRSQ